MPRPIVFHLALAALIFVAVQTPIANPAIGASGDVAGLFEIDGSRKMHLECRGTSAPTSYSYPVRATGARGGVRPHPDTSPGTS